MPAFNAEATIAFAIESVLAQDWQLWELLIVNDGSQDQTEVEVKRYKDARIYYFWQENAGVSEARNNALRRMKGEFFCFLDADDALPRNSLSSRLEIMRSDSSVTFVDGKVEVWDHKMMNVTRVFEPSFGGNPFVSLVSLDDACFFGLTWMVRNEGISYQMKKGLSHGEDLLFFLEISKDGGFYTFSNSVVYRCRRGINSAMSNLRGLENGYRQVYRELCDIMPDTALRVTFRRKTTLIMIKSYLSKLQIWSALRVFLTLLIKKA